MSAVYPKATIQDNVVYYITVISIAGPSEAGGAAGDRKEYAQLLKPDMTVSATLYLNRRDNVLAVPGRAIKREGGKKVVQVLEKGRPATKTIKTGWKDGSYTEIIEGLKEGDIVITGEAVKTEKD